MSVVDRMSIAVANRAIEILRKEGFDCVDEGGYYDVSKDIHKAIKTGLLRNTG